MKTLRILLLAICLVFPQILKSQNPIFKKHGIKVVTLSNGKYNEFHDQDTIVEIGSALFNTKSGEIVGIKSNLLEAMETEPQPEIISRWMCIDPLAEEYSSWSPYVYVANNPIIYIDPNGKEIVVGSWIDRTLNAVGYKTSNMQKLGSVVTTLKSTKTGNALYNKLDGKKEKINLVTGENLKTKYGNKAKGLTSFTGGSDKDGKLVIMSDITVTVDVEDANEQNNQIFDLEGNEGATVTVAHEFGHVESTLDNMTEEAATNEAPAEEAGEQVANEIKENKKTEILKSEDKISKNHY